MKKLLCLLSAVLLVFASCSNDDSIGTILPARIVTLYAGSGDPFVSTFHFNGNKIVSRNTSQGLDSNHSQEIFTYTGNLITGVYDSNSSGNEVVSSFEYDTNERMISRKILFPYSSTAHKYLYHYDIEGIVSYEKYSGDFTSQTNLILTGKIYKNSNGLVMKIEEFIQGILANRTEYTYDTKNATGKNIIGWDKLISMMGSSVVNNILTVSMYDATTGAVIVHSYQYVYNNNNYPVSFSVLLNGEPSNFSGEFFYE